MFQHTAAQRRLLIVTRCRLLCGQSFQHTAARRRLPIVSTYNIGQDGSFNTQPHEGGCPVIEATSAQLTFVSTHSRTKAAALADPNWLRRQIVSTHSRTKAAATGSSRAKRLIFRFNTQPHEGGCPFDNERHRCVTPCFNTQPHEGGCKCIWAIIVVGFRVSTHSRTKAAACHNNSTPKPFSVFQHTAARRRLHIITITINSRIISFNTQPHEGGCDLTLIVGELTTCFNTQPHEGGCSLYKKVRKISELNTVFR